MKFLVLGSLNIDIVYQLPHIVAPGETITSYKRSIHPGGKGANQAAALARAGADTFMAGKIGADGIFLKNILDEFNVNTSMIKIDRENPSGHGLIQLAQNGENSIVLFPGTNRQIGDDEIDRVISNFTPGDIILLQNEINSLEQIITKAAERKMKIAFNPAPFTGDVMNLPIDQVSYMFVNRIEAAQLTQMTENTPPETLIRAAAEKMPNAEIILTLGSEGALHCCNNVITHSEAFKVSPVDTTGAGDTFIGFFLCHRAKGEKPETAMQYAAAASAIAITRLGAMNSIPSAHDVENFISTRKS